MAIDLPFACTAYPNDIAFRASVALELRSQFQRIRNHPSLALICGKTRFAKAKALGLEAEIIGYTDVQYAQMLRDYDDFFKGFIPNELNVLVPHVQYIDGSPLSSNWGIPESFRSETPTIGESGLAGSASRSLISTPGALLVSMVSKLSLR